MRANYRSSLGAGCPERVAASRREQQGWTLLELVLVIALIALLSILLIPRTFDTSQFRDKIAQEKVLFALRTLQQYAITSGCEIQYLPETQGAIIRISKPCSEFKFSDALKGLELKTAVTFYPNGQLLASSNVLYGTIKMVPATGLIYVE
ncbi:MAG: prepilin-type N-terminal cleavage/methylation domain-containing protein [Gammaproteobacteria bacterium]